jgi:hypothetical protein
LSLIGQLAIFIAKPVRTFFSSSFHLGRRPLKRHAVKSGTNG